MRQRLLSICLLPLAILAALPALTSAQEITGTIVGKATDQTGAVLPGRHRRRHDTNRRASVERSHHGRGRRIHDVVPAGRHL